MPASPYNPRRKSFPVLQGQKQNWDFWDRHGFDLVEKIIRRAQVNITPKVINLFEPELRAVA